MLEEPQVPPKSEKLLTDKKESTFQYTLHIQLLPNIVSEVRRTYIFYSVEDCRTTCEINFYKSYRENIRKLAKCTKICGIHAFD